MLMTNMQDNICQRVLKNTQDPALHISARRVFTNTQIYIATSRVLTNMKDPVSQICTLIVHCTRRNLTNRLNPSSQIHKAEN